MNEYLDEEGYPNDKAIEELRRYTVFGDKFKKELVPELIEFIKSIWCYEDGISITQNGNGLEIHTFGWSGNETIIEELQTTMLWLAGWRKTTVGGHYYFKLKERYKDEEILLKEKIEQFSLKLKENTSLYHSYLKHFDLEQ